MELVRLVVELAVVAVEVVVAVSANSLSISQE